MNFATSCLKPLNVWFFNFYRVIAIFGSASPEVESSVSSVCSSLHIPHLTTSMKKFENEVKSQSRNLDRMTAYSIHLGPSQQDLVTMMADVVKRLKWTNVALITHRTTGRQDIHNFFQHINVST